MMEKDLLKKRTEEVIANIIKVLGEEHAYAKNKDGIFEFEVYVDYQDMDYWREVDWSQFDKRMHAEDFILDKTYESEDWTVTDALDSIYDKLSEEDRDFIENELATTLRDLAMDYGFAYGVYPMDNVMNDVEVNVVHIPINSDYSTYAEDNMMDLNGFLQAFSKLDPEDEDYRSDYDDLVNELRDETVLELILESQGVTLEGFIEYMLSEDDTEDKFLRSFYKEVYNSYGYNNLAFMETTTLNDYFNMIENNDGSETITFTRGMLTGLIDPCQGGGSILEMQLNNDITLDKKNVLTVVDGAIGYKVTDIYGMRDFN